MYDLTDTGCPRHVMCILHVKLTERGTNIPTFLGQWTMGVGSSITFGKKKKQDTVNITSLIICRPTLRSYAAKTTKQ